MPLTMEPNFEDLSCRMIFGQRPPEPEDDQAFRQPCFSTCPTTSLSAEVCPKLRWQIAHQCMLPAFRNPFMNVEERLLSCLYHVLSSRRISIEESGVHCGEIFILLFTQSAKGHYIGTDIHPIWAWYWFDDWNFPSTKESSFWYITY